MCALKTGFDAPCATIRQRGLVGAGTSAAHHAMPMCRRRKEQSLLTATCRSSSGFWQSGAWYRKSMTRLGRDRLSGLVEVDEILVGGKRRKFEGRSPQGKTLVLVAVEDKGRNGIGRIRMQTISNATTPSLRIAVIAMVKPGSTVRTDGWTGYRITQWGYRHLPIPRRSLNPGEDPTPLVHRVSSLLKRWMLGTHQGGIQTTHLQEYLDEFVFRFNRRTSRSRGKLFYRLIQNLLHVPS